jgi:hypothetical protein
VVEPIPFPDPLLGGPGFMLRPYRLDDVSRYAEAVEDPSTSRWLNSYASGDPAADLRLVDAQRAAGKLLVLTIADSAHDRYLGMIALVAHEAATGELAYLVVPRRAGEAWRTARSVRSATGRSRSSGCAVCSCGSIRRTTRHTQSPGGPATNVKACPAPRSFSAASARTR